MGFILVLMLTVVVLGLFWWLATVTNLLPSNLGFPGWNANEPPAATLVEREEENGQENGKWEPMQPVEPQPPVVPHPQPPIVPPQPLDEKLKFPTMPYS